MRLWLVAVCLPLVLTAHATEYAVGTPPAWVQVGQLPDVDTVPPQEQISDGTYYALTDLQTRVENGGKSSYRRIAAKAINAKGVESIANIEIRFDPSYSKLTLHSIDVIRAGRVISKLPTAEVRVLQRETSLEYRVFDGAKTASVFLDDVRVGDIVDYSYTIQGSNPVFGGREFGSALLQYSEPVARLRVRLLFPVHRSLPVESRNTSLQPTVVERAGERIHEWDLRDVAARVVEEDTPGWYDMRPLVQWSEYADWGAVAHWAWPLYEASQRPAASIRAEAMRIVRDVPSDPEERMLAVLRFVQREIRYLAVSVGPGSHAPNAAERVLERRFGDCKDKTQLTIALLAALGIEARPALVDTVLERGVSALRPSPGAFDHVIVSVRMGDRRYWIDPTRSPQNGDAAHIRQADYGVALIVDPATDALTTMDGGGRAASKRSVASVLDASAGFDAPVGYTITTIAEGARADEFRAGLAASNLDKLQQQYLNYYARYYPDITVAAPLEVSEDAPGNRVTTVEHYSIGSYWTGDGGKRYANVEVPDVDEALRQPTEVVRKAPLRLKHPLELVQQTELRLPEAWTVEPETTRVEDPAFVFERSTRAVGKRVLIEDRFESRADEIPGGDAVRYAANLARAQEATALRLTWRDPFAQREGGLLQRFNWSMGMLALLLLALWTGAAIFLYRRDPPAGSDPVDSSLQGIGGWLLLPAIAIVIAPFRTLYEMKDLLVLLDAATWAELTTYGASSYSPLWAPVLLFELAGNSALLVFALLVALMFFQRRRAVPRLYITLLVGGLVLRAADLWISGFMPVPAVEAKDWVEIARDAVSAALWTTYFLVSRRVRSTFVVSWSPARDARRGSIRDADVVEPA